LNAKDRPVNGPDGFYGTVDTTCWPSLDAKMEVEVDLQLNDGGYVPVPADMLIEQSDGSFYLALHRRVVESIPRNDRPAIDGECWPCRST
jgi:hypothetical protein